MDGGNFLELAVDEIAATAGFALEAMPSMPSHADALPGLPLRHIGEEVSERYEISQDPRQYFEESDDALNRASAVVARQVVSAILNNF